MSSLENSWGNTQRLSVEVGGEYGRAESQQKIQVDIIGGAVDVTGNGGMRHREAILVIA
jgi:hypothetical protein